MNGQTLGVNVISAGINITAAATLVAKKPGFLFRARKHLWQVFTLYVSQNRPNLEYFSGIWESAVSTTLQILAAFRKEPPDSSTTPFCLPNFRHLIDISRINSHKNFTP